MGGLSQAATKKLLGLELVAAERWPCGGVRFEWAAVVVPEHGNSSGGAGGGDYGGGGEGVGEARGGECGVGASSHLCAYSPGMLLLDLMLVFQKLVEQHLAIPAGEMEAALMGLTI